MLAARQSEFVFTGRKTSGPAGTYREFNACFFELFFNIFSHFKVISERYRKATSWQS